MRAVVFGTPMDGDPPYDPLRRPSGCETVAGAAWSATTKADRLSSAGRREPLPGSLQASREITTSATIAFALVNRLPVRPSMNSRLSLPGRKGSGLPSGLAGDSRPKLEQDSRFLPKWRTDKGLLCPSEAGGLAPTSIIGPWRTRIPARRTLEGDAIAPVWQK